MYTTCGGEGVFDCGSVSGPTAPYSAIGSIPVATLGLVGYVVIFGVIWLQDWVLVIGRVMREILLGLTSFALLFTLYLTYLEAFVLNAWCLYCLSSAAIVVAMFVLALTYALSNRIAD